MTEPRHTYSDDGEPSPLSSPLGTPFASPEVALWMPKIQTQTSLSVQTNDLETKARLSFDAASSDYDYLARSPLLDHEHGLGPSGLRRIRRQPQSMVLTLPNSSSLSGGPPSVPRASSNTSSREAPAYLPVGAGSPALEDLHRFPSESLHSFSFAQQSEELLHSRQNILKRSIDFMKDRFGWAASNAGLANSQARMSDDIEIQSMMELFAKAHLLEGDSGEVQHVGLVGGPVSGPADVDGENIFEKAFTNQPSFPCSGHESSTESHGKHNGIADSGRFLNPVPDGRIACQRRGLKSAPASRRVSLKRTWTDLDSVELQSKLMEAMAQPYSAADLLSPTGSSTFGLGGGFPAVHTHSSKWSPVAQAVFRTEANPGWTILAANDLACLIFGVTQAEVRKLSILDLVQKERRQWLESKLRDPSLDAMQRFQNSEKVRGATPINPKALGMGNGVTAQLLSKPPSRQKIGRKSQTEDGSRSSYKPTNNTKRSNHSASKSRGVLLCGDVVPILKRNGATGSASLWVMEKRGGLIWVVEEVIENIATLRFSDGGLLIDGQGDIDNIWGQGAVKPGISIINLLPRAPTKSVENQNFSRIAELRYFTALTSGGANIPITVTELSGPRDLRISSFPHVAGMMVLSASTLSIISANSVFSAALFGQERPDGSRITDLVPQFDEFLNILTEEDKVPLVDGMVIPEHSFRRARALSILRDGKVSAASLFLRPSGLLARHRDGSEIIVDIQMRVAKSETLFPGNGRRTAGELGGPSESERETRDSVAVTEVVYALWITYSRHLHGVTQNEASESDPLLTTPSAPPQPSPGQRSPPPPPPPPVAPAETPELDYHPRKTQSQVSLLTQQLNEAVSEPLTEKPVQLVPKVAPTQMNKEIPSKKGISEYIILEEMGQGAYGQVKLARSKRIPGKKVVLKYVTKKRILVDTWTRDRRLGTVPLEIHVLDYLRRDGLKHPNIVEMEGFFEDDVNYYIEMVPHGLPGMDLFDYIELRSNMDEGECRNIFSQVVDAIHHLHTKALVVHRDIKDENVILDGEGRIKLIDFGSAAYIKNGPFDVFVGTIDYAAPEVLQGKSYRGKEQDVWALGILLYTIIYKENPFYNIDEILDHPLRIPFLPFSDDCIDLIRKMLDRDVDERLTITEVLEHTWLAEDSGRPRNGG